MKKILALLLTLTFGVFGLAACGGGDSQDNNPSAGDTLAGKLSALFVEAVNANPDASGEEIAEMLIADELLANRDLSTYNMIDTEFMVGFDADFAPEPFEKATYIQTYGNDVFLGYVYELADGADTEGFMQYLEQHADNAWNGVMAADQTAAAHADNLVFFVMLSEDMPEQADYNQMLVDRFETYMSEESDTEALSIAEHICGIEGFPLELSASPVEQGWLAGLEEFDQFTDGAAFAPMIGSIPFMGYVFMLDADVDAAQVVETIKGQANLAWNVCTEADVLLCDTYKDRGRNAVLVIMAPEVY